MFPVHPACKGNKNHLTSADRSTDFEWRNRFGATNNHASFGTGLSQSLDSSLFLRLNAQPGMVFTLTKFCVKFKNTMNVALTLSDPSNARLVKQERSFDNSNPGYQRKCLGVGDSGWPGVRTAKVNFITPLTGTSITVFEVLVEGCLDASDTTSTSSTTTTSPTTSTSTSTTSPTTSTSTSTTSTTTSPTTSTSTSTTSTTTSPTTSTSTSTTTSTTTSPTTSTSTSTTSTTTSPTTSTSTSTTTTPTTSTTSSTTSTTSSATTTSPTTTTSMEFTPPSERCEPGERLVYTSVKNSDFMVSKVQSSDTSPTDAVYDSKLTYNFKPIWQNNVLIELKSKQPFQVKKFCFDIQNAQSVSMDLSGGKIQQKVLDPRMKTQVCAGLPLQQGPSDYVKIRRVKSGEKVVKLSNLLLVACVQVKETKPTTTTTTTSTTTTPTTTSTTPTTTTTTPTTTTTSPTTTTTTPTTTTTTPTTTTTRPTTTTTTPTTTTTTPTTTTTTPTTTTTTSTTTSTTTTTPTTTTTTPTTTTTTSTTTTTPKMEYGCPADKLYKTHFSTFPLFSYKGGQGFPEKALMGSGQVLRTSGNRKFQIWSLKDFPRRGYTVHKVSADIRGVKSGRIEIKRRTKDGVIIRAVEDGNPQVQPNGFKRYTFSGLPVRRVNTITFNFASTTGSFLIKNVDVVVCRDN